MAAGRGTRMNHPDLPKVMVGLAGRPMVARVLDAALALDPVETILIVGHRGELVSDYVRDEYSTASISIVEQRTQLGTAHAIMQTIPVLDGRLGDLLVLSGDVPMLSSRTLRDLVSHHAACGSSATMLTVELDDPTGYGRVLRGPDGALAGVVEQKDADEEQRRIREINAGVYVFDIATLLRLLPQVSNDNAAGEYYLPDVFTIALRDGERCDAYRGDDPVEVRGVNTPEQLAELEEEIAG